MKQTNAEKTLSLVARTLGTRQDRVEIISETESEIMVRHIVKNNAFRYRIKCEEGRVSAVYRM